jgi:hypothetical protein
LGKFDDASIWLSRALAVKIDDTDSNILLGEMLIKNGKSLEEGRRYLEKVLGKVFKFV